MEDHGILPAVNIDVDKINCTRPMPSVRPFVCPSARPTARPYDLDYPHDNSVNIFQIFFEPCLEYSLGKYLGQVRPLISQLIAYAHNGLTSDFDIFDIPEVFFF